MFTLEDVTKFLYREARLLDDRDWDGWLACYDPEAEFWMPSWDDDDTLVEDPQTEISLIYYPHRGGLEDRVFRIRTERSSATSLPAPRRASDERSRRASPARGGGPRWSTAPPWSTKSRRKPRGSRSTPISKHSPAPPPRWTRPWPSTAASTF